MVVDTWGYDVAQLTPLLALLGKQYIPEDRPRTRSGWSRCYRRRGRCRLCHIDRHKHQLGPAPCWGDTFVFPGLFVSPRVIGPALVL